MLAFGLVLLLFFYFLLVGSAALRQLHARREATQDLLMSPTVGAIFTVVPLFVLNRMFSIPVAHGGPVVAILGAGDFDFHLLARPPTNHFRRISH